MKNIKRITAAAAAITLAACTLCTPVCAASVAAKDESVYVTLNADGSAATTTVSEWLHSEGGFNGYKDTSALSDIKNLRTDVMPEQNGSSLVWNTDDTDIYYQGTTTDTVPVTAKITYSIDGTQMSAEDAAGKSGHLKIDIALTNNSYENVTVSGKSRKVYTPFVVAVGTNLPVDSFTNVVAEHGTVQTDSSNQIVAFACMPGMKDTFNGILTGSLADIQDKFIDSVSIEADVTDLAVPSIMIAYATDATLLEGELDTGDYGDAFDDIDKLTNATQQLVDGANQLADGTAQLRTGTQSLSDGASTLANGNASLATGSATLANGSATLATGSATLSAGAASLTGGLATLSGKSAQLNAGAQQIAAAVLDSANTQLQAQMPGVPALTLDNYAQVLGTILNITDDMRAQARATVSQLSGLPDVANADGSNNLTALIYLASQQLTAETPTLDDCKTAVAAAGAVLTEVSAATAEGGAIYNAKVSLAQAGNNPLGVTAVQQVLTAMLMQQYGIADPAQITADMLASAYASLAANLGDESDENKALVITMACLDTATNGIDVTAAMQAAGALAQKAKTAQAVLTASADGTADTAVAGFLTQLVVASSGTQLAQVSALLNSLQSLNTFVTGLKQYTDGVDSAYVGSQQVYAGAKQVSDGAATLQNGANTLSSGAATASAGAATLASGAASAASGAAKLDDGAQTLANGVSEFKTEGVDKVSDALSDYDLDGILDTVNALRGASTQYRSFSGASNGTVTTTKFVMKTNAPASSGDTSTSTADETQQTEKTSFWQRIKNLFK